MLSTKIEKVAKEQVKVGGFYVYTHGNTQDKIDVLNKIAREQALDIKATAVVV